MSAQRAQLREVDKIGEAVRLSHRHKPDLFPSGELARRDAHNAQYVCPLVAFLDDFAHVESPPHGDYRERNMLWQ